MSIYMFNFVNATKSDQKALFGMSHVKSNYKMKDRIKKLWRCSEPLNRISLIS